MYKKMKRNILVLKTNETKVLSFLDGYTPYNTNIGLIIFLN